MALVKHTHFIYTLKVLGRSDTTGVPEIISFFFFFLEPNLLSGTAHSVNKRGVKRRDLDIEELKEILSPLLPYVRMEHVLPANSDVLSDAVSILDIFSQLYKRIL